MELFPPAPSSRRTSGTSAPPTSTASPSAISSLASGYGPLRSAWPASPTISRSGPAPVRANLSAREAQAAGLLTSGTFGPPGTGSSSSIALQSFLASRLKALSEGRGSTLYRLTWKDLALPSGRLTCLLRASALRTSGSDFFGEPRSGWPTPTATDADRLGNVSPWAANKTLNTAAALAGWASPTARDYRTPNHRSYVARGGGAKGEQQNNQVAHLIPGASLNGLPASTGGLGLLTPAFSRWLQGIPEMWDACAPTETRSTLTRRRRS